MPAGQPKQSKVMDSRIETLGSADVVRLTHLYIWFLVVQNVFYKLTIHQGNCPKLNQKYYAAAVAQR
jgi:hypothetical protein